MWAIIWGYSDTLVSQRKQTDIQTSVFTQMEKAIITTTTSNPTTKSTAQLIEEYHSEAKRRCLADYKKDAHVQGYYCPCLPTTFRKLSTRDIIAHYYLLYCCKELLSFSLKWIGKPISEVLSFETFIMA